MRNNEGYNDPTAWKAMNSTRPKFKAPAPERNARKAEEKKETKKEEKKKFVYYGVPVYRSK